MGDPAQKYQDRVDPQLRMAMDIAIGGYHTLKLVETQLRKVDEAELRSHSIGHIVDPTLYRDQINSKSFAHQMVIIRAALAFIGTIDALKSELVAAGES